MSGSGIKEGGFSHKRRFNRRFRKQKLSHRVFKLEKQNRKEQMQIEKKYFDFDTQEVDDAAGTSIFSISQIVQGDGSNQRIGSKVFYRSLQIRWHVQLATTGPTFASARMIILYDKQSNAALASAAQVLQDVATPANAINSPINYANRFRFKILYDSIMSISPNGNEIMYDKFYRKFRGILANFAEATSVALTGDILVLFINTAIVNYNLYTRLRFMDS